MFTVRDAESAMIALTSFSIAVIVGVFLYNLLIVGNSTLKSLSVVLGNVSNILSAATLLTILEEGISLMFYRIRLALKEEREIKEQGRQEAYQEVSDWNQRRLEAEARGETFTEPPPGHDSLKPKKKKRFIFF
ncbi:hypothetical protein F4X10_20625 [Candidatus Poribacteria bacterium]|nr:hypothetical protein [Candidatus Poribacteria bacterium]